MPISIKITSEIERILIELQAFKEPLEDFLLPIVTVNKEEESGLYDHIGNRRKKYTNYLKNLAMEFEFEFNLTSYVSRHTMAMQLQDNNIPENVISQILGHKDLATTKVYLDSLNTNVIDEAAKVL